MKEQHDSLQYICACLLTHTYVVEQVIADPALIKNFFALSLAMEKVFYAFIHQYGERLLASAKLSEEKRWRELLGILKYAHRCIAMHELKQHWRIYLLSLSCREIPQTPLLESIFFLNHLLSDYREKDSLSAIIQYEIFLNQTLQHDAMALTHTFSVGVSKLIDQVKQPNFLHDGQFVVERQPETLVFLKTLNPLSVKVMTRNG